MVELQGSLGWAGGLAAGGGVLLSGQHQGVVHGLQDVAGTGWYLVTPGRSYNAGGHQTGLLRWDSAAALAVGLHTHRLVMVDVVCGGVTAAFSV